MFRFWADSKAIKENWRTGGNLPMVAVEFNGERLESVQSVQILGASCIRTDISKTPQVWIETESEIEVFS